MFSVFSFNPFSNLNNYKMTLFRLRAAPFILIEDDINKNALPLLLELAQYEKNSIQMFCYDHPVSIWRKVFKSSSNISYHEDFLPESFQKYTNIKSAVIVDSVNQMSLCLGWTKCLNYLQMLLASPNVGQIILILHTDCLSHNSKMQIHLQHIANAIVTYNANKINVQMKKSGKIVRSEETLSYDDKTKTLKCTPIIKATIKEEEPVKVLPSNLSTFKIEVDQTDKLEKYKLQLPYMSKIGEGQGKVFYEPDAVDDWDEEDPDDDLDI